MTRKIWSEGLGTAMLLVGVVGSGIMGETLAGGSVAIALLANAIATGCMLYVIITVLGPLSGAHFNPAVTLAFWLRKEITTKLCPSFRRRRPCIAPGLPNGGPRGWRPLVCFL